MRTAELGPSATDPAREARARLEREDRRDPIPSGPPSFPVMPGAPLRPSTPPLAPLRARPLRRAARPFAVLSALCLAGCLAEPKAPGAPDPVQPGGATAPQGPTDPGATLDTGEGYWRARCAGCHGAFEGRAAISLGDANGDFRLDANAATAEHGAGLAEYIARTMPFGAADACVGDCAEQTAAYIRGRSSPAAPSCEAPEAPVYGIRTLKLLSSVEYENAVEDLLGVGAGLAGSVAHNDGALGGFVDMRGKGLSGATLDTYVRNAEAVAAAAVAAGRPFTCGGEAAACGARFVDEFLFEAFRGPVSDAQRDAYVALFEAYPDDGMRLALEAALTSPYFLYRVEAGVDLATALERGFYTNLGASAGGEGPSGPAAEVIEAADFVHRARELGGHFEADTWAFWENGAIELVFETAFTDPTTVEIEARGTNYGDTWPELELSVDGTQIGLQAVDHLELRSYRFTVRGHAGATVLRIAFGNDQGVAPWGPGNDVNLYIARVGLTTASETPEPEPEPPASPLEGVAEDAYVLTPYELASTLSFMLTGSTPDRALLDAARADRLTTRAQLRAQVERLIDSPRGRAHLGRFVTAWFGLDGALAAARPDVPELTPAVKAAMIREVEEHFFHVFYDEEVPYHELFDGAYTFLNRPLAEFYGVQGNFTDDFVKTEVEGRGGPIASGAFMTANAHAERTAPILRAVHARQAALCHYIDPPNSPIAGEDIDEQRAAAQMRVADREAEEGALSSRDFYFLYTDGIEACAGCHERIINPMFGMEDFDHVGRLRPRAGADAVVETIRGIEKVVSLQGTLHGVDAVSDPARIDFAGAKDFSDKIARTDAVRRCLARKTFRYLTGLTYHERDLDTGRQERLTEAQRQQYACVAERMQDAFEAGGESARQMLITLATESLVRLRR